MPSRLSYLTRRLRRCPLAAVRAASRLARGAFQTGAPFLGLCGIVLIWVAVLHSLAAERKQALQAALQETSNLSRAFEEHIIRSLKAVDQTLLYIRDSYEKDPGAFDIAAWTRSTQALTDLTFQIALIDRNGRVIGTNLMASGAPVDLSDREHFRVHRDSAEDVLFISKPVLGRVSHKWSIQLTRKMIAPDGTFDGVVVVSLDPQYLSRFYEAVDLGRQGAVALTGIDGVIRARAARDEDDDGATAIGKSIVGGRLLGEYARSPSGSYIARSGVDGTQRVTAYRGVRGYKLIVSVGTAVDEVLAAYTVNRRSYIASATAVSAVLLLVTVLVVVRQARLNRAREQLRESEASHAEKSRLLEVTLEHMSQGIMMVDANRRVQVCNHRAIEKLGLPAGLLARRPRLDEVLQWQWQQGEFGEDGAAVPADLRHFILAGGTSDESQAYERIRPNGTVLEIRSVPLGGGGFVRTYTDITQRKETEATLRSAREKADQAARAKSEFLATMSHEIRSPMSGLVGVVELLRETALDQDQRWMAGMIHSSAQNLLAVLNDILDFSKIEAGAFTIALQPVTLRNLVNETVQPHALEAARKGVALDVELDPHLPDCVQTDALRLRQILTNLLSNAVKFTPAGTILLSVEATGAPPYELRFSVQDSGIGMPPDVVARLFAPFMQADGSTTRNFGGTGLGLCISQRLAGMLHGHLAAQSQLGEGSRFTLDLPLLLAKQPALLGPSATPAPVEAPGRGRALVADDDATNRWLAQRQLTLLGWTVDVAEDGSAALAMLRRERYDLLLTDCHMPKLDGVALARAVRADADPARRALPIIGVTADATAAQHERCLAAGMGQIAIKPVSRDQLERLLIQVLAPANVTGPEQRGGADLPPVFDETCLRDLFSPGDPDVEVWLADYLASAAKIEAELTALLGTPNPAPIDRTAIAAAAHRLAGSSLSVGASRLGAEATRMEAASPEGSPALLAARQAALRHELAAARAAIDAFAAAFATTEAV